MINKKYYNDITQFPSQFAKGLELAKDVKISGEFERVVVCGMGGSSLYVELINDLFKANIVANRSYKLPAFCDDKTLFIIASYSGNTQETLACLEEVEQKKYHSVIFTSGGKLGDIAKEKNMPLVLIPTGIQPRLCTGYFIASLVKVLENCNLLENQDAKLTSLSQDITADENKAKELAKKIMNKVPIIYSTTINLSLARISKIKFNENSKTQAFFNYFPELNHNEMVGFSNLIMQPFFIILKSKFADIRNVKRIEVFSRLMKEKKIDVEILEIPGKTLLKEMINTYHFMDFVTYYLAESYGVDPEPVAMVEEFKQHLVQ